MRDSGIEGLRILDFGYRKDCDNRRNKEWGIKGLRNSGIDKKIDRIPSIPKFLNSQSLNFFSD